MLRLKTGVPHFFAKECFTILLEITLSIDDQELNFLLFNKHEFIFLIHEFEQCEPFKIKYFSTYLPLKFLTV